MLSHHVPPQGMDMVSRSSWLPETEYDGDPHDPQTEVANVRMHFWWVVALVIPNYPMVSFNCSVLPTLTYSEGRPHRVFSLNFDRKDGHSNNLFGACAMKSKVFCAQFHTDGWPQQLEGDVETTTCGKSSSNIFSQTISVPMSISIRLVLIFDSSAPQGWPSRMTVKDDRQGWPSRMTVIQVGVLGATWIHQNEARIVILLYPSNIDTESCIVLRFARHSRAPPEHVYIQVNSEGRNYDP